MRTQISSLSSRSHDQEGFTLIELLVVILIIGILAAIALPAFLGQRVKGQDSAAKSDVRNGVSEVESCYATEASYVTCATTARMTAAGLTSVVATGGADGATGGYTLTATSKSNNTFAIRKAGKLVTRTCTSTGSADGGCPTSGSW